MKASELLNNALKMLGYSDSDGNVELTNRIRNGAITIINLVYEDLWRICETGDFEGIKSINDEIKLPLRALGEVFVYGLAMHIARSENDGDQQQYYVALYNSKRSGLSKYMSVKNILPYPAL